MAVHHAATTHTKLHGPGAHTQCNHFHWNSKVIWRFEKNKLNNNLEDKNANDESRNIILILCQTHRLVYITDLYS